MITALLALVLWPATTVAAQASMMAEPVQGVAVNDRKAPEGSGSTASFDDHYGMVYVPAGEVTIGTPADQVELLGQNDEFKMKEIAAETPQRRISVDAFFIDRTEVTNLQWKVFLDATGRQPSEVLVEYGWPGGEIPAGQEHYPVTNVNFPEIQEYCTWVGRRLPTEDEWVRAARGDDERTYPWGDRWDRRKAQSGMTVPQQPTGVGTYPEGASPHGALDMAGNVIEWTSSGFTEYPGYKPLTFKRGREKVSLVPHFDSTHKVLKGGNFVSTRETVRIDYRVGLPGGDSDAGIGFRTARSPADGLEPIRHAWERLLPPSMAEAKLDELDIFGIEKTDYNSDKGVVEAFHFLGFAHRAIHTKNKPYSRLKKSSVDEPFAVGVLTTSERLLSPDLPAGEYTLAYKYKGESKKHREQRKTGRSNGSNLPSRAEGAMVPWPGVPNIHDVVQDIDYPQDKDMILFLNASNTVVGWVKCKEAKDADPVQMEASPLSGGKNGFSFAFSVEVPRARRMPYFEFDIEIEGDALK